MAQPKTVQVRPDIKQQGQDMERRMRGADPRVRSGDIEHHRRMDVEALCAGAQRNLDTLKGLAAVENRTDSTNTVAEAAADLANYARFIARRITGLGLAETSDQGEEAESRDR